MERAIEMATLLLSTHKGTFRNMDLARALGVSRQRCSVLLRKLVAAGIVEPVGRGCGRHYRRGPGSPLRASPSGLLSGADAHSAWHHLASALPWFVYIRVSKDGATRLRTRGNIRHFLGPLQWTDPVARCAVLDLHGIRSITLAAADELLDHWSFGLWALELINACDEVRQTLELAGRLRGPPFASTDDPPPLPLPPSERPPRAELDEDLREYLDREQAQYRERMLRLWRAP